MSITIWLSYNNIAFKINPGDSWKDDKERLKLIQGRIPIYNLDKFSHWEVDRSKLTKLFEVYQNKVLVKPEAKEYIDFYKLQTTCINKLPKNKLTVKSLDGKILDPYQEDWVCIYEKRKGLLGLMDMSAGKTLCSLLRASQLTYKKLLVVAPAEILNQWQNSIEGILGVSALIYTGSIPKAKRAKLDVKGSNIIICNFEMLKELEKLDFDSIIIDEAHLLGKSTNKIYKSAKKIIRKAQKDFDASVQALTATPIEDSPLDLWYLINLVNPELAGDKDTFFNNFQEPIFWISVPNPRVEGEVIKKAVKFKTKNTEELKDIIAAAGMRISKEVFIKIPKNKPEIVSVPMTEAQRKIYNEVREELLFQAQDKTFFLNNPLTRLQEVLKATEGGFHFLENETESGKLEYIDNELKECQKTGRKAIIYFRYLKGSEILHSWYPESSVLINGNQSANNKRLAKIAFQGVDNPRELEEFKELKDKCDFNHNPGSAQFLIRTYNERAGIGSNYQCCDLSYFVSYDFSATAFSQANARTIRRDSPFDEVFTKLVVSEKSIETVYIQKLLTKVERNANLLDGYYSNTSTTAREIVRDLERI